MSHRFTRFAVAVLALLAVAAAPQAARAVDTGSATFSKYVALGDSLTAGFSSGSINVDFQSSSYPSLIFQQATGQARTAFEQPLVSAPGLPPILELKQLVPIPVIAPKGGQGQPINLTLPRPYDNMAVPGANVHDVLVKKLSVDANDPTDLVLRKQGFTQLEQGLSLHPTFVTLWIGNNDALSAATNGNPALLTDAAQFDAEYKAIANAIAGLGAKMAIATIPDVTSIPFVTTLTRFIINPATGQPVLVGGNPVPLIGVDAGDFVLLSATRAEALGFGIPVALGGNGQALPGNVVLTPSEVATIQARVAAYNTTIRSVASDKGAALVDANATLADLATRGINVGGVTFTAKFLSGGVFSYDGVHPTPFGYAFVANMFIDAINAKFGGHIPQVDLFPFVFKSAGKSVGADTPPFYFSPLCWDNLRTIFRDTQPQPTRKPPRRRGHH